MPNGTPSAFFSYSRHDSEFVLKLAKDLRAAGAGVWLDQLDITPGQRWDSSIEKALAECPHLLVVLSPSSVESTNVMDEVSFALEESKLVIPVLYRDCKIPFRLRRLQYIDARVEYEKGLAELLRMLAIYQPADSPAPPVSPTARKEDMHVTESEAESAAKEKASQERIIQERAEAERRATERSAAEAREREKASQERMARDRADAERLAKEKADRERIARQKEEFERQAARKAEQERRDRAAAEKTPGTSRTKYLIAAAAAVVVILGLWAALSPTRTPPVRDGNASAYVPAENPVSALSAKKEIEPDSERVRQFLSVGEGPPASRLRSYFDDVCHLISACRLPDGTQSKRSSMPISSVFRSSITVCLDGPRSLWYRTTGGYSNLTCSIPTSAWTAEP